MILQGVTDRTADIWMPGRPDLYQLRTGRTVVYVIKTGANRYVSTRLGPKVRSVYPGT